MDDVSFDRLAKALSTTPSRRHALGLGAGTALGGLASLLGLAEAEAGGKKKRRKRRKKKRKKTEPSPWQPPRECLYSSTTPCGATCIPEGDCCVDGTHVPHGGDFRHCGFCLNGLMLVDPAKASCSQFDREGCHVCTRDDFLCNPGGDGKTCMESCGTCLGGLCEPDGSTTCVTGCCPSDTEEFDGQTYQWACCPGKGTYDGDFVCCPSNAQGSTCCVNDGDGAPGCCGGSGCNCAVA